MQTPVLRNSKLRFHNVNLVCQRVRLGCAMRLLEMLLLVLPSLAQAQLMFTMNNDGSLNITGYSGSNGIVIIPSTINGLPVDSVGD